MDNEQLFEKKLAVALDFMNLKMDCQASELLLCSSLWNFACLLEHYTESSDFKTRQKIISVLKKNDLLI